LHTPNLSHPTPCSTSTNFNQLLWVSEWVISMAARLPFPFPLTSWHLSEINNCTSLADWFLQALLMRHKMFCVFFFPFLFAWHFVVGKMCFTEQRGCCKLAELAHE
jgi:hypothetical protein